MSRDELDKYKQRNKQTKTVKAVVYEYVFQAERRACEKTLWSKEACILRAPIDRYV